MWKRKLFTILIVILLLCGCGKSVEQQIAEQLELGQKYLAELDYEQAIVAFNKAIELDPKVWDAYTGIAKAYQGQEKYAEATEILEDGMSLIPMSDIPESDIDLLFNIYKDWAESAKTQGDKNLLLELYEKMLAVRPDDKDVLAAMDAVNKQLNEEKEVLQYEQSLADMASKIMEEEDYNFSDTLVLSEEFQSMIKDLSSPVVFSADGDKYIGVYPGGYIYYGQMQDNMRSGEGKWFYGDIKGITVVSAAWSNDRPNGPATIYIKKNPDRIEREEGRIYALETRTTCNLVDGVYDGNAEIEWTLESGNCAVHSWSVAFADGYLQDLIGGGTAALCKNCGADLLVGDKYYIIEGLEDDLQ